MVFTFAPQAYKLLNGVFAVYKPSGIPMFSFAQEIYFRLVQDLNKMKQRPQKQMVIFKPEIEDLQKNSRDNQNKTSEISRGEDAPRLVPDWFDHPLVQGPRYTTGDISLIFGHTLDEHACGVQVIGLKQSGEDLINQIGRLTLPRRYVAKGQFGTATLLHRPDSKVVDTSTWDHITAEMIDRVLCIMLGVHRNAAMRQSGVNLCSQQAYDLATQGLLKPVVPTEPMILDLKLASFNPPDFSIDLTCVNESCQFVRKMIHMIGYELKSTAVCTQVQRQSDAVFTHSDKHTLLGHQINANSVIESMRYYCGLLNQNVLKPRKYFQKTTVRLKEPQLPSIESGIENYELENDVKFIEAPKSG